MDKERKERVGRRGSVITSRGRKQSEVGGRFKR